MTGGRLAGFAAGVAAWLAVGLAGCATSGGAGAGAPGATVVSSEERGAGSLTRTDVVAFTATVEAIDHATRQVTLLGPEGDRVTFRASDEVRNLDQVEQGDQVRVELIEAFMVRVVRPGDALPGVSAGSALGRAEPGARPGAVSIETLTVTSTVTHVDRENRKVTLRGASGETATVPVRDPAQLDHVAVGDLVEVTATQALAIAVEAPGAE
jgi:Cu/Ag efflux protein CusF